MFFNRVSASILPALISIGLSFAPSSLLAQNSPNPTPTPKPSKTKVKATQQVRVAPAPPPPIRSAPRPTPAPTPKPDELYTWAPPKLGEFKFVGSYTSLFDTGSKIGLETDSEENYWWKNEVLLGIKHSSGWGLGFDASIIDQQFDGKQKDSHAYDNPYMVIYHPPWYKEGNWVVAGWLRQYYPTSDPAVRANQFWTRYFLSIAYQVTPSFSISNLIVPSYISQTPATADYAASATFYTLDETDLNYSVSKYLTIGFGQDTQYEQHQVTNPGWETDLFPYIDITPTGNFLFELRVYFPVFVDQSMSFGSQSAKASLDQLWGEFTFKAFF